MIIKDTVEFMDIEIESFTGLPNLQAMELCSGSIILLPYIFNGIKNIKKLTISIHQTDKIFARSFLNLKSLKTLNIYDSNLEYLDADRFQYISLTIENFEFRNCEIRLISII